MRHVLIADDNPLLRKTAREILDGAFPGVHFIEASGGWQVRSILEVLSPDLVIMDIKLGGENGLNLAREIKAKYPRTAILIFASEDMPEYRRQAGLTGAEYFLSKLDSKARDLVTLASGVLAA